MRKTWQERWWEKIAIGDEDDCWLFTGAIGRGGYGEFWDGESTERPRSVGAHRWSYAHFVGEIPAGLDVLHHCDNPPCVKPSHLWVGTHAENMADAVAKGRFSGHSAGGRHVTRKNDWDSVREIRRRYRAGESRRDLAREFGLEYSTVRKIARGAMWPEHLDPLFKKTPRNRDIVSR